MRRTVLVTLLLATAWSAGAAAQGYPYGYAPPQPRRAGVGYNCEALQQGVTGVAPFSCPLPGARRLGTRCFCDQPLSAFSGVQPPLAGQVVP